MEKEKSDAYLLETLENCRNLALQLAVGVNFYLEQCKENTPKGVTDEAKLIIKELKKFNLSSTPAAKHHTNDNNNTTGHNKQLSSSAPNNIKGIYPKTDQGKMTFTKDEKNCFSIISYHLLASSTSNENYMLGQVIEKLHNYQSDIFCLQDVKNTSFDLIRDNLSKVGYCSMSIILPTNNTGLAFFYKKNRFTLLDNGIYPYSSSSRIYYCNFLFGSDTITVVNVHLIDHKYHFILELLKWVGGLVNNNKIIICGDFCVEPNSHIYDTICRDNQNMFCSVYKEKWKKEPNYTCQKSSFLFSTLDYVIYNKNKLHLLRVLSIPSATQNLPNSSSPSDHHPVGAIFMVPN